MLDPWFQRAKERRLKAVRNWIYWKIVEKRVVSSAEALLFTCSEEMRLARTTFVPYKPKREAIVGLGIEPPPPFSESMQRAFEEKCPEVVGRPFLIFLGRIDLKKGVDVLLHAYASVSRLSAVSGQAELPKLVIAGPGLETKFGKEMQELASRICPPGSVFWPDMLTGDAKWGALYMAVAFVLASHQENFGLAVVEALSCGTPVLISDKINIWKEIQKDHAALVGADSADAFGGVLRQWIGLSQEQKDCMRKDAVRCYKSRFHADGAAENVLAALRGVSAPEPLRV
jgi:glycosyltransferase involved in cell wall biosynthesis